MGRFAFLPFLMFALACSDSTIIQPGDDPGVAATVSPRTALTFQLLEDPANDVWGEQRITPSGVLHIKGFDFGYRVVGDLTGTQRTIGGVYTINLNNGKGIGSGTMLFELTAPGAGTFECSFHGSVEDFPVHVQRGEFYNCKGTGYYAALSMRGSYNNEANPGVGDFDVTAEIW